MRRPAHAYQTALLVGHLYQRHQLILAGRVIEAIVGDGRRDRVRGSGAVHRHDLVAKLRRKTRAAVMWLTSTMNIRNHQRPPFPIRPKRKGKRKSKAVSGPTGGPGPASPGA